MKALAYTTLGLLGGWPLIVILFIWLSKSTFAQAQPSQPQPSCTFSHPVAAIFCLNGHTGDCHVCKPEPDGSTSCWSVDLYNMCKH